MACYLGRYSGFGLVFSDTQQLPLVLSPQFQYIIVIIQDAPAVADADVMERAFPDPALADDNQVVLVA